MTRVVFAFGALLVCAACSSSSSSSGAPPAACNQDPFSCAAGTTCWPKADGSFACLNSGSGKTGDACQDTVGIPTCGDGLMCAQTSTTAGGTCVPYCDPSKPAHACTSGACTLAQLGNGQISVCYGATAADAGHD